MSILKNLIHGNPLAENIISIFVQQCDFGYCIIQKPVDSNHKTSTRSFLFCRQLDVFLDAQ